MSNVEILSKKIKNLRKKLRLTQTEFANQIGITISNLSLVETGKRMVSLKTLYAISKTYNVPLDYFFEDEELEIDDIDFEISEKTNMKSYFDYESIISEYKEREKLYLQKEEMFMIERKQYLETIANLSKP